jgi:hypothetical protein
MTPKQAKDLQEAAHSTLRKAMIEMAKLFDDDAEMFAALILMTESVSSAAQVLALSEGLPRKQVRELIQFGHATGRDVATIAKLAMLETAESMPTMPPGEA